MRLNGAVVRAKDLVTVFTFDGQPVFLTASIHSAVLTNVLIEHFKLFLIFTQEYSIYA
jgi:hypothetical protein